VLNGIFYILRTGTPWRDPPERYGPRTTIYNRYVRWGRRGVWKGIFDALAKKAEDSLLFIDGRQPDQKGSGGRYWTLTRRPHK